MLEDRVGRRLAGAGDDILVVQQKRFHPQVSQLCAIQPGLAQLPRAFVIELEAEAGTTVCVLVSWGGHEGEKRSGTMGVSLIRRPRPFAQEA